MVQGISFLIDSIPALKGSKQSLKNDSLSKVAPFRIVNIGNSDAIKLNDFIKIIEDVLDKKAIQNFLPLQKGDVIKTLANNSLLKDLTNFSPQINYKEGITRFIEWYRKYYNI